MHASVYGRGTVLHTIVQSPVYDSKYGDAPYLDSVLLFNEEEETLTLFAVNKDLEEDMEISCDLRQFVDYQVVNHIVLSNDDLKAENTEVNPDNVTPRTGGISKIDQGKLTAIFEKKSWNVVLFRK